MAGYRNNSHIRVDVISIDKKGDKRNLSALFVKGGVQRAKSFGGVKGRRPLAG